MLVIELLGHGVEKLKAVGVTPAEIDAQLLLGHCLGKSRTQLFLAAQERVPDRYRHEFLQLLQRRMQREPVAYLLREREFWSLPFFVNQDVLIPRPETEFLLETVFAKTDRQTVDGGMAYDLCCGSGVIGIILARELRVRVVASDISLAALRIAQKNSKRHGVDKVMDFINADLFSATLPERKFSLIVSNPPYVRREEIFSLDPEVKSYEPHLALDGGVDGLNIIAKIHHCLPVMLQPGGSFFMEFGDDQAEEVKDIFQTPAMGKRDFEHIEILQDYSGRNRVLHAMLRE